MGERERITSGEQTLWIYGYYIYMDGFEEERQLGYCLRMIMSATSWFLTGSTRSTATPISQTSAKQQFIVRWVRPSKFLPMETRSVP
jgi:hypothetical protein